MFPTDIQTEREERERGDGSEGARERETERGKRCRG